MIGKLLDYLVTKHKTSMKATKSINLVSAAEMANLINLPTTRIKEYSFNSCDDSYITAVNTGRLYKYIDCATVNPIESIVIECMLSGTKVPEALKIDKRFSYTTNKILEYFRIFISSDKEDIKERKFLFSCGWEEIYHEYINFLNTGSCKYIYHKSDIYEINTLAYRSDARVKYYEYDKCGRGIMAIIGNNIYYVNNNNSIYCPDSWVIDICDFPQGELNRKIYDELPNIAKKYLKDKIR